MYHDLEKAVSFLEQRKYKLQHAMKKVLLAFFVLKIAAKLSHAKHFGSFFRRHYEDGPILSADDIEFNDFDVYHSMRQVEVTLVPEATLAP